MQYPLSHLRRQLSQRESQGAAPRHAKRSVSVPIRSVRCFMITRQKRVLFFHAKIHFMPSQKAAGHISVDHGKGRSKQEAVKPVQNTSVSRKNFPKILNAHRPLDR